jgi:hypothetical protein
MNINSFDFFVLCMCILAITLFLFKVCCYNDDESISSNIINPNNLINIQNTINLYVVNETIHFPLTFKIDTVADITCSICLEQQKKHEEWCELICKHKYHKKCIDDWIFQNNNCPICRSTINIV